MPKTNKLQPGDRIAYAAKFLRDTRQLTGASPQRRGTFAAYYAGDDKYARVHWDDEAECIASGAGQYGEQDYCDDVRKNGSLVCAAAIAKVGSPRFALNDM